MSTAGAVRAATYLFGQGDARIDCYSEQFAYGHRELILQAAGYDMSCLILGRIPHGGWTRAETIPQRKVLDPIARELPQWMWNEAWVQSARAAGARKVIAIGAPWLYLLRMRNRSTIWETGSVQANNSLAGSGRTLLFPVHSCEDDVITFASMPRKVADLFDPSRTTVCLAWQDFLCRETRLGFESHGFAVECAGYRGTSHAPGSTAGDRTRVLPNVLALIEAHDLVIADAVSTALIYAASLGKLVQVIPGLSFDEGHRETDCDREHGQECAGGCLYQEHPWMQKPGADPHDHRAELADALGWPSLRTRQDLQRLVRVRPGMIAIG
ncbi:MAG: hypothetical protein U0990_02515 [Candidatus Nanopelagicales bacterium]|nr:hypothetical protein [Candidatus Nanopelagicales bacterium]MDZ4248944.1 hypothetical protein [Candidatus Nanopelagicales bacterium]